MVAVEKLKHITVCYHWPTYNVKLMIQEHYDLPEYENTAFLINTYNICDYSEVELIKKIEFPYHFISLKFISQSFFSENNIPEMNTSRFILDTLRLDDMATQNQVRIFELLCMGYTVCAEKCGLNMFPGLIYEWETVDELTEIAKNKEYLHPTEAYKEMTYTDKAYEEYVNNLIKLQCI